MTATTSHNVENETTMHKLTTWAIAFGVAYFTMFGWWTHILQFNFIHLLQQFSPETQQYFDNRTQAMSGIRPANILDKILDIIFLIVSVFCTTYMTVLGKKMAEKRFQKKQKLKENK